MGRHKLNYVRLVLVTILVLAGVCSKRREDQERHPPVTTAGILSR